ncbi:hypothetical protein TNIN_282221 [Trichonephila inaurata madagascariensis]|uniref:Uncharacterized protein n=1 Tax=Trichonephila inaurata madagascariensis TaxID=2747483 RepID=A0A8X6MKU7_9ARAC|nr:hypothetical protein TNIN_282221 [Trichonephila inaurata madagascariensis]
MPPESLVKQSMLPSLKEPIADLSSYNLSGITENTVPDEQELMAHAALIVTLIGYNFEPLGYGKYTNHSTKWLLKVDHHRIPTSSVA